MKKMALVLAAVLASGMILTACGGSGKSGTAGNETQKTEAEGNTAGGLDLAVQIGPDPETIDPALNSSADAANMILHAFETLLTFDKDN
ncbi:peptide ABC transporter substrate-binding protein, partial [Clostridioides difficile]|nr:peptide ABC transporter substrate-binding protein [Clostridioides difficile]